MYIDWQRYSKMASHFKGGKFLDIGVFNSPLIIEYKNNGKSRWIHCSYSTEGNAGQTYTYVEDKNTGSGLKKLFS